MDALENLAKQAKQAVNTATEQANAAVSGATDVSGSNHTTDPQQRASAAKIRAIMFQPTKGIASVLDRLSMDETR